MEEMFDRNLKIALDFIVNLSNIFRTLSFLSNSTTIKEIWEIQLQVVMEFIKNSLMSTISLLTMFWNNSILQNLMKFD